MADAPRTADVVIHVESRAQDWRISHAARQLEGMAAGARATCQVAAPVDGCHMNRPYLGMPSRSAEMIVEPGLHFGIDCLGRRLAPVVDCRPRSLPVQPDTSCPVGQQVFLGEAACACESQGSLADNQHAICLFD